MQNTTNSTKNDITLKEKLNVMGDFIKEFVSCDLWYTNDYWYQGEFLPPFNTAPNFLSNVVVKINQLDISDYPNFSFKNIEITEENIDIIFNECFNFIVWWNAYVEENIIKDIKLALKNNLIKVEKDAEDIAIKYLTEDIISYKPTCYISDLLPKNRKIIYNKHNFKHPYFKGLTKTTLFEDDFGRLWSNTVGVIKEEMKIKYSVVLGYSIDVLGGLMWSSKDGINFKCEYRTSKEDINKKNSGPDTFVG